MTYKSLPMRGEWIEIAIPVQLLDMPWSLPMRGEWIEILISAAGLLSFAGLSPCGESGLKCAPMTNVKGALYVSPHAGRVD